MKRVLLPALLLLSSPAKAQEDSWTGPDKKKHFVVSMASGFMVRSIFPDAHPWQRYSAALIPGLLKEVTDPVFSYKDMTVNFLGVIAGDYLNGFIIQHSDNRTSVYYTTSF